jgi:hypothetical protein
MDEEFMMVTQASSAPYTTILKELVETISLLNTWTSASDKGEEQIQELKNDFYQLLMTEINMQKNYQSDCVVAYNDAKAKEKKATVTAIK